MSCVISRRAYLGLASAALALSASRALAQAGGPQIRLIIPLAPGGGTDSAARLVGTKAAELLHTSFLFDNRPGASGMIALSETAKSPANGMTLVIGQTGNVAISPLLLKNVPFDPLTSIEPVAYIADVPIVFLCAAEQPYKSFSDIVAAARNNTDITYSSSGHGDIIHLSGELIQQRLGGFKMRHIAYKGAAPALTDVLGGRVTMIGSSIASVLPLVRSGKLRALAVTSGKRSSALPDVPTIAEQTGLADFSVEMWYGIFAPAGVPKAEMTRLNGAFNEVLGTEEVKAYFANVEGGRVRIGPPELLGNQLRADLDRWRRVIEQAHITVEE